MKKNITKKERRDLIQDLRLEDEETLVDSRGRKHKRMKVERWESEGRSAAFGQPRPFANGPGIKVVKRKQ
jgi:hypothetical protein